MPTLEATASATSSGNNCHSLSMICLVSIIWTPQKGVSRQHEPLCKMPCSTEIRKRLVSCKSWKLLLSGSRSNLWGDQRLWEVQFWLPILMVKITASSNPYPTASAEISHQLESYNFLREILFPWLKKNLSKSNFTKKKIYMVVLHFSVTWTNLNCEWKTVTVYLFNQSKFKH